MPEDIYSLEIFKWFDKEIIDHIINSCETREYKAWEIIVIEWEKSNWEWYIIKSWKISVKIWNNEIIQLKKWEIFWEIALLNEEKRTATIKAINDIEVIVLKIENIIEMIDNDDNKINKTVISRIEENLER